MTGDDRRERQRCSFGGAAHEYERVRPGYPAAALAWLLAPGARRVADLGAGTGKFTRVLADAGLDVVAVEPSAGMRAEFARALPGVPVVDGSGEALPFEDGSLDAVVAAQAWHWVDPARAVPEVARVLRPGGSLGLVWNLRVSSVAWVDALETLLGPAGHGESWAEDVAVGPPFGPLERHELAWRSELRPEQVVDLVASRSYVLSAEPPERERLLDAVRRLLREHPDTRGRDTVTLPYRTLCYRAVLPG
jgi:SAM-dependent methyltransferase